ncbi:uncharacterized protein LOC100901943 [Galendromus occidentalis]|uniref:Uncharacterized protein LOC100901943 n=1 Tax=Galendromus occidentalis TaxID=34638 RepID=A0AAJ6QYU4_9ACAR|nr:uncharacterized protein LOC100901943 [Galendromus occidentalis]
MKASLRLAMRSSVLLVLVAFAFVLSVAEQVSAADAATSFGNDVNRDFNTKRIIALLRRSSRQPNALADSCRLYGHSCLGGHGKRSSPVTAEEVDDDGPMYRIDYDWLQSRI